MFLYHDLAALWVINTVYKTEARYKPFDKELKQKFCWHFYLELRIYKYQFNIKWKFILPAIELTTNCYAFENHKYYLRTKNESEVR